ncbi:MAG: SDR family oxidoreductase [Chloroflexota bacterium]
MDLKLKGKTAIVTGAGSRTGFGRQICLTLAGEGANIVAADINLDWVKQTAAEVTALGQKALAVKADVTKPAEMKDLVKAALGKFGRVDIMVNNAGIMTPMKPFVQSTEAEWDKMIAINLKGVLNGSLAVIDPMVKQKYGKIVNIASIAGRYGPPNAAVYGVTKAGVVNFTRALALELIPFGINVNCVCPGAVLTTGLYGEVSKEQQDKIVVTIPRGVQGRPEDIANMVTYLASDVAVHIVGQAIAVDGGKTMI